jgi:hypothetical protein
MNARVLVAVVLILLGILGLAYGGFSYTTRDRVVDAGPIKIDADVKHRVPIAPIVGGIALAGGIVLLVTGRKGVAA